MFNLRPITIILTAVTSTICASGDVEYETNGHTSIPLTRSTDGDTVTRISQARSEESSFDIRKFDLLSGNHGEGRELTTEYQSSTYYESSSASSKSSGSLSTSSSYGGTCTGSRKMCGCAKVSQSDYRGYYGVTKNGFKCREWTMAANYPNQGLEDGAYCRNPNKVASQAWCFVEDENVLWDYCSVPMCKIATSGSSGNSSSTITLGCINTARYDAIDADILALKNSISNDVDRSHFLGGIVRLVAHDFMDYDANNERIPYGPDGCILFDSSMNAGLTSIWCDSCPLKKLYNEKYSDLSRADFWVVVANSVIRQTSINNELDLKKTFYWGRKTRNSCPNSDLRLASTASCLDVEGVFLERMGLTWKDAVALLGAHTLGRGNADFSGHHGTWVPNDKEAQIFDKKYYEELFRRAWRQRNVGTDIQDWTTGSANTAKPKMMLNTDICLLFDIDSFSSCCTRTGMFKSSGQNRCEDPELSESPCRMYSSSHPRFEASQAVKTFLGGPAPNSNNAPFYNAFAVAWFKATTNGMDTLKPLKDTC